MITLFPTLIPELSRKIIDNSDCDSLIQLSGVNRPLNDLFSNASFKKLFDKQHPDLARYQFEKLCAFFPANCWKIACSALFNGKLLLSQAFISECSPHIHRYVLSQRAQIQAKVKDICGSFYEDPDSPIDKAWKAKERIAELQKELKGRQTPLLLEIREWFGRLSANCPNLTRIEIFRTLTVFYKVLQKYTDEDLLNPNEEITLAIHHGVFLEYKEKFSRQCRNHHFVPYWMDPDDDESIRRYADDKIALRFPDLCTILSSEVNSHAIRHISKLLTQVCLFSDKQGFEEGDPKKADKAYRKLEQKRRGYSDRLQIIEEELTAFDACGEIALSRTLPLPDPSGKVRYFIDFNDAICKYKDDVHSEFGRAKRGEIAIMRLPHLEDCQCLIQNLIENPEEISPDTLANIRQMINACDSEDISHIWGQLYDVCASGVDEDQWSEHHFPEFLKPLEGIVYTVVVNYRFERNCMGELRGEWPSR